MPKDRKQIGWLIVPEGEKRTLHYEYAAWYKELLLDSGRFPLYASFYTDVETVESLAEDTSLYASVEGTVTSDDFSPAWGGVAFASKHDELIGKRDTWSYTPYAHALALAIIEGRAKHVELLDGFVAEPHPFVSYDGRNLVTYKIREVK